VVANIIDGQVRIFDEIYQKGMITEEIADMVMTRDWWSESAKYGVIDVAARQHQGMPPIVQVWLAKAGLFMQTHRVKISDGIERMKSFLKIDPDTHAPRMVIDSSCQGLLSEFGGAPNPDDGQLRAYRWRTDREGNVTGVAPEDKYCDAIKAVWYGLWDRFGPTMASRGGKIKVRRW
jgi:hypothetical protein